MQPDFPLPLPGAGKRVPKHPQVGAGRGSFEIANGEAAPPS